MGNSRKRCKFCKDYADASKGVKTPFGWFGTKEHAILFAQEYQAKTRQRRIAKAKQVAAKKGKAARSDLRARKEAIKKRTGKNGFYDNLKAALHKYIKHVLRKGEPCYTCGKAQSPSDSGQAFHVGHFIPQKQVDPRRFMLINLKIQCYSCNTHNSGMRAEYRQRLIEEIGIDKVDWLECDANHKELKQQYPEIADIKSEAARYRKLLRDNGVNPCR